MDSFSEILPFKMAFLEKILSTKALGILRSPYKAWGRNWASSFKPWGFLNALTHLLFRLRRELF